MPDNELYEHRLKTLESNVRELSGKANAIAVRQAETNAKLDGLLLLVGELKESVDELRRRPSLLWDKLIFAAVGAAGTALGYAFIALLR